MEGVSWEVKEMEKEENERQGSRKNVFFFNFLSVFFNACVCGGG